MQIQPHKGTTDLTNIATPPVSDGSYTFTVPTSWTVGSDYTISVSALSGYVWAFSGTFTVAEASLPDLTVSSISGVPDVRNLGQTFSPTVQVSRSGGSLTNGTYVRVNLYASTDANITTSDNLIGGANYINSTLNSRLFCKPASVKLLEPVMTRPLSRSPSWKVMM